jgi:hypothetical protein
MLVGCSKDVTVIGPGECLEVHSGATVYLEASYTTYVKLSQELCDTMAHAPRWTAPPGVTIEDAAIRVAPSEVEWDSSDKYYSAEGAVLEARAVLCAADQLTRRSTELRVTLPMMARISEEAVEGSEGEFKEADFDTGYFGLPALDDDVPEVEAHNATFVHPDTLVVTNLDLRETAAEAKRARSFRRTLTLIGGSIAMLICLAPVLSAIFPALLKALRNRKR